MANELVARNGLLIKGVQSGSTENEFLVKDAQGVVQSRTVNLGAIISGVTQNDFLIWSGGTWVSAPGIIGVPTDGTYTDGFFDTWTGTTKIADAVDDLNEVIKKLAPGKPPELSTKSLVLSSYYPSAILYNSGGTSVSHLLVSDLNTTDAQLSDMEITSTGGGFNKSVGSNLTGLIDGVNVGAIAYTDGDIHTGTTVNGKLTAIEYDYWGGVTGKANFWPAVVARVDDIFNGSTYGLHTTKIAWYVGATESQPISISAYYDNPATPTNSLLTLNVSSSVTRWISGVPSLTTGDVLAINFTYANLISQVYRPTPIATSCASTTDPSYSISGVQTPGSSLSGTITPLTVEASKWVEDITVSVTATNAKGTTLNTPALAIVSSQVGKTMRVDTVSNESTRKLSGGIATDFPTTYGGVYNSGATLLTGDYQFELQMFNGYYRRIAGNYTNNYPTAGPNYSVADPNSGYRWVMFSYSISAKSAISVTVAGTNFSTVAGTQVTDNMKIFVKVEGSTNWFDANTPYPGVGNPTNDGDYAMVTASSTASATNLLKFVTFGTNNYTGTLYVRLGMASGSNDTLTSISVA